MEFPKAPILLRELDVSLSSLDTLGMIRQNLEYHWSFHATKIGVVQALMSVELLDDWNMESHVIHVIFFSYLHISGNYNPPIWGLRLIFLHRFN